jgi:hypothetical protein
LKTQKELRRQADKLNSDLLLKNQVIEEVKLSHLAELQNLESEFEALQHKYDRKELVL